ncbi:hypothetical protein [Sinorhizobium meliloti]|uniref:hypothetical protein n=1 Tax=Rhizobium meliloti TaxID=382 RepID=UPI000FE06F5B|nr:hypothetical protein [Sinorhizobium meliloti]RVG70915.1 hypothetical protein CN222_01905 [Sinorhizobium meliloti]
MLRNPRRPILEDLPAVRSLMSQGLRYTEIWQTLRISKQRLDRIKKLIAEIDAAETTAVEPSAPAAEKEKKKPIRISSVTEVDMDLSRGKVHRFILSAAQDDTPVFEPFWRNLLAYSEYLDADIGLGGYTYQLGLYENHAVATAVYAPELHDYLDFDRTHITDSLLWIGDANVLPTTANPLNGWTTANRGQHVIVPHARVTLESIPRMQGQPPRIAISTGTVTQPSYTPRASGRKALFHHTYGALLVQIDTDGEVFFRHLLGDADGNFQDLDVKVVDGVVTTGHRVAAITWGDIHHEQLNPTVALTSWGYDMRSRSVVTGTNILDRLAPHYQFLEDLNDFRRRNHHGIRDPHQRAMVQAFGSESVEDEVKEAAAFANAIRRDWCRTVMVESNHDAALARWLKDPEGALDAHNAYYWHDLNAAWHRAIRDKVPHFNIVEEGMRRAGLADDVEFVNSGGSYLVGDVECGLHGDLGVGGSRGSPNQYRRFGPKTSSGHTHTPKIVEGVYVAGVSANLDQGYNKGPTTWAHAHIVQYDNGKRAMLIMSADGRYEPSREAVEYKAAA